VAREQGRGSSWLVGPGGSESEREEKHEHVARLFWAGAGEENGPDPRSTVPLYIYSKNLSKELN
jgi:hypothetical protein